MKVDISDLEQYEQMYIDALKAIKTESIVSLTLNYHLYSIPLKFTHLSEAYLSSPCSFSHKITDCQVVNRISWNHSVYIIKVLTQHFLNTLCACPRFFCFYMLFGILFLYFGIMHVLKKHSYKNKFQKSLYFCNHLYNGGDFRLLATKHKVPGTDWGVRTFYRLSLYVWKWVNANGVEYNYIILYLTLLICRL